MTKRKAPEDKLPVGRPSGYKPEYVEEAFNYALLGATLDQMAELFEVSGQTIRNWRAEHPELFEAIKAGKAKADGQVSKSLYQRAMGYEIVETVPVKVKVGKDTERVEMVEVTRQLPPDPVSCIFWLKNRRPDLWRDRHEVTGKNGAPIEVRDAATGADLSEHEVRVLRQILQARDSEPEAGAEGTGQAGLPGTADRLH